MADIREQNQPLDIGVVQVALTYATALLASAGKAQAADRVLEEFDELVRDVLPKLPQLPVLLESPRVPDADKAALLDKAFAGRMAPVLLNFLKVVAEHGRFAALWAIHRGYRQLYNEQRGRVVVQLETAAPLAAASRTQVEARLRQVLGDQFELHAAVNPELIGGFRARVGDRIYDASVSHQLKTMRREAVDRTAKAIRQNLQRFVASES